MAVEKKNNQICDEFCLKFIKMLKIKKNNYELFDLKNSFSIRSINHNFHLTSFPT